MSAGEARRRFLEAFPGRLKVQSWLSAASEPGFALLPLLILCCLAASEAAELEGNDYRMRMKELMGWDDRIFNCAALPSLWKRLQRRTREEAARSASVRPLELPDPRYRTQIGHAIELTFPSRQDVRVLSRHLESAELVTASPQDVLSELAPLVSRGALSPTFRDAYNEFCKAWRNAERALVDHRFWSGWTLIVSSLDQQHQSSPFEIVVDEWGDYHMINRETQAPFSLRDAAKAFKLPGRLLSAVQSGAVIPLIDEEWGRFVWCAPSNRRSASAALIRMTAFSGSKEALNAKSVSGAEGWKLSDSSEQISRSAQGPGQSDLLLDIFATGCSRVEGGLLARPALSFQLEATRPVETLELEGDIADQFVLERYSASSWRARPKVPVDGILTVAVRLKADSVPFRRRLRFARSVLVPKFKDASPDRFTENMGPPTPDWPLDHSGRLVTAEVFSNRSVDSEPALADVTEWLAARTSPTPLSDLYKIVSSCVSGDSTLCWDVIQALGDAGMISMLDVRAWRGRSFLSRAPRGALAKHGADYVLTFEGVLGETFLSRLEGACAANGLYPETFSGVGRWSPPTIRVRAVETEDLTRLANDLDLPMGVLRPDLTPITSFITSSPLGARGGGEDPVSITLNGAHARLGLQRSENPLIPPYWLVGEPGVETRWLNREEAVLEAYRLAKQRPFSRHDNLLVSMNARLPRQVARWIRFTTGVASGPVQGGYAYAISDNIEAILGDLEPSFFSVRQPFNETDKVQSRRWSSMAILTGDGTRLVPVWKHMGRASL